MSRLICSVDCRDQDQKTSLNDPCHVLKIELNDLDNFCLKKRNYILYDAGFPHVIKALEPRGRYFFSYDRPKPYIRSDGRWVNSPAKLECNI